MKLHPEQQPDELYLGNIPPEDLWKSYWKTSRLGSNPLRSDGTPYTGGDLKPWFIKRSEVEAAVAREQAKGQDAFDFKIRAYTEMLEDGGIAGFRCIPATPTP